MGKEFKEGQGTRVKWTFITAITVVFVPLFFFPYTFLVFFFKDIVGWEFVCLPPLFYCSYCSLYMLVTLRLFVVRYLLGNNSCDNRQL